MDGRGLTLESANEIPDGESLAVRVALNSFDDCAADHHTISKAGGSRELFRVRDAEADRNGKTSVFAKPLHQVLRIAAHLFARASDAQPRDSVNKSGRILRDGFQPLLRAGGCGEKDSGQSVLAHLPEIIVSLFERKVGHQSAINPGGGKRGAEAVNPHA